MFVPLAFPLSILSHSVRWAGFGFPHSCLYPGARRALTSRGSNLLPDKSEAISLWARAQYWAIYWIGGTKVGFAGINRVHIQYTLGSISWVDFCWKIRSWLTSLTVAFVSGISDLHFPYNAVFFPRPFKNWLSTFPHLFWEKNFLGKRINKLKKNR